MNELIYKDLIKKGANINNISNTDICVVENKNKKHYFINDINSTLPYILGLHLRSRTFIKRLLDMGKISNIPGESFNERSMSFAINYAKTIEFPVQISSDNALETLKIVINNELQLKNAFNFFSKSGRIFIEKFKDAQKYKCLIFKSGYSNLLKINNSIINGNGKLNINQIIEKENTKRINTNESLLKINELKLKILGYNLDDIIKLNEIIDIFENVNHFEEINKAKHKEMYLIMKKVINFFPQTSYLSFELTDSKNKIYVGDFDIFIDQNINYKVNKGRKTKFAYEEIADTILSL